MSARRGAAALLIALVVPLSPVAGAQGSAVYGYVAGIPGGSHWAAQGAQELTAIAPGAVLHPGDLVTMVSAPPGGRADAGLSVVLYTTGKIVVFKSGEKIPAPPPSPNNWWSQLVSIVARRLNNGSLDTGYVRAAPLMRDAAFVRTAKHPWSAIVGRLEPGDYHARYRRLDADGAPAGSWTDVPGVLSVSDAGLTPDTLDAALAAGVWQIAIRHDLVPTLTGEAWVLVTDDRAVPARFAELTNALDESARDSDESIAGAASRVRRATLLALNK